MVVSFFVSAGLATANLIFWATTGFHPFLFTAGLCTGLAIGALITIVATETK